MYVDQYLCGQKTVHALFRAAFLRMWSEGEASGILLRKMFDGYLFLETGKTEEFEIVLKKMPRYAYILSITDADGKHFMPISPDEEEFLDTILTDGMMGVSYISAYRNHKVVEAIGPLEHYVDKIVDMNLHHRRAIATILLMGEERRIKDCSNIRLAKYSLWIG